MIYVSADDVTLNMSAFTLSNGQKNGLNNGGAMTVRGDNTDITLTDVLVQNSSTSAEGGGILLTSSNSVLTLNHSLILNNEVTSGHGGGIACIKTGGVMTQKNEIHLNHQSGITLNQAVLDGGGIYATGCDLYLRSGVDNIEETVNLVGISANTSGQSGGGVRLHDGNIYTPNTGSDARPINIDNNVAGGLGGGIRISQGTLEMTQLLINRNSSAEIGGGIHLNASLISSSDAADKTSDCLNNGYNACNLFINNTSDESGGAISLTNSGMENILHSIKGRFENNTADSGSVARIDFSSIRFQNSYFLHNGQNGTGSTNDQNVFFISSMDSSIDIFFSTIANNNNAYVFGMGEDNIINLHKSIVYEDLVTEFILNDFDGTANLNFSCTVFHQNNTIGSVAGTSGSVISTDPGFIDPVNGDYHLLADSIAIDRCNDFGLVTMTPDRDGHQRGLDVTTITDEFGPFDAGADEYVNTNDDVIFMHGFE